MVIQLNGGVHISSPSVLLTSVIVLTSMCKVKTVMLCALYE